ncbi:MAG: phosphatidylinositol glycan class B, partial [Myxococcota bacterium]
MTQTHPQASPLSRPELLVVLAVAAIVRLVWTFAQDGMHYPDEIFQYLEPPFAERFGHGWLPWEFVRGARNWLLPWHYSAVMEGGILCGFEGHGLLRFVQVHNALFSLLVIPASAHLARLLGPDIKWAPLAAAATMAMLPILGYFSPHTLSEGHATIFLA